MHFCDGKSLSHVTDWVCALDASAAFSLSLGCDDIMALNYASHLLLVLLLVSTILLFFCLMFVALYGCARAKHSSFNNLILCFLLIPPLINAVGIFQYLLVGRPNSWAGSRYLVSQSLPVGPLPTLGLGYGFYFLLFECIWLLLQPMLFWLLMNQQAVYEETMGTYRENTDAEDLRVALMKEVDAFDYHNYGKT